MSEPWTRTSMPGRVPELCPLLVVDRSDPPHQIAMHRSFEALITDDVMLHIKEEFCWPLVDTIVLMREMFR